MGSIGEAGKLMTCSSRASGRSRRTEPTYQECPLCGSKDIALGSEHITVSGPKGEEVRVRVRRWACPGCHEQFLTDDSRRKIDVATGLENK